MVHLISIAMEKAAEPFKEGQRILRRSTQVKAVDTTAAGDTFTGYFFAALSKDKSIPEALLLATKASAISVTRKGAEASIPNILEVQEALKSL
ncbi:PfkB family carbohydrate kinase [Proteiniclasticum sp. QWL-01]|uniref:PfkB family carbohydrate kinase n=1 Tax=Proteiniclasticum sp. QWL-01 TaxID=3036945 RepID=UPI00241131E9|nr:PfkB family carbohydrate kinase [Proteiniclasticum sp. QWL-01]WFF73462.1 PfkB family carbohydrate kinase [Proteiniclasticum sp. QWL-01]